MRPAKQEGGSAMCKLQATPQISTIDYSFLWSQIRVCSDGDKAMAEYDSIVARGPEDRE
jgi:hypothetical protein